MIYPVITLYQPWATWIMRGWKTIETRTHNRFACLDHKTILIHAGKITDLFADKTWILLNSEQNAQVCDARDDEQSDEAGNKIIGLLVGTLKESKRRFQFFGKATHEIDSVLKQVEKWQAGNKKEGNK